MAGPNQRVHPSRRHNNPNQYKSGNPRLRGLNLKTLKDLFHKTQQAKNKAKINKEILRRFGDENIQVAKAD